MKDYEGLPGGFAHPKSAGSSSSSKLKRSPKDKGSGFHPFHGKVSKHLAAAVGFPVCVGVFARWGCGFEGQW